MWKVLFVALVITHGLVTGAEWPSTEDWMAFNVRFSDELNPPLRWPSKLRCPFDMHTQGLKVLNWGDRFAIQTHDTGEYATGVSCKHNVTAAYGLSGVSVAVYRIDTMHSRPCIDYVEISSETQKPVQLCGRTYSYGFDKPTTKTTFLFVNEAAKIVWRTDVDKKPEKLGTGFRVQVVAIQKECTKQQEASCFACDNGFHIHISQACNGVNNCGDGSDEVGCLPSRKLDRIVTHCPKTDTQ